MLLFPFAHMPVGILTAVEDRDGRPWSWLCYPGPGVVMLSAAIGQVQGRDQISSLLHIKEYAQRLFPTLAITINDRFSTACIWRPEYQIKSVDLLRRLTTKALGRQT